MIPKDPTPSACGIRYALALLALLATSAPAVNKVDLSVARLLAENLEVFGFTATIGQNGVQLSVDHLTLNQLTNISGLKIHCKQFSANLTAVHCRGGRIELKLADKQVAAKLERLSFDRVRETVDLRLVSHRGALRFDLTMADSDWRLRLDLKNFDPALLQPVLPKTLATLSGRLGGQIKITGHGKTPTGVEISGLNGLITADSADGIWAVQSLALVGAAKAHFDQRVWHWRGNLKIDQGAVYYQPVYLEVAEQPWRLLVSGTAHDHLLAIDALDLNQPGVGHLTGYAELDLAQPFTVRRGFARLENAQLESLGQSYLSPYLGLNWPLTFSGQGSADIKVRYNTIEHLALTLDDLNVTDAKGRIDITGADAVINWPSAEGINAPSWLSWRELKLAAIPVAAGHLDVVLDRNSLALRQPASIPLLGGMLTADAFSIKFEDDHPDVIFQGALTGLKLEQLSQAFGWPEFSGRLSGNIPGVRYQNRVLRLDGALTADLFGGTVKLDNLSSSGLFRDLWRLEADIDFDRLDLAQVTDKFDIGRIEGRLSGFIHDLVLENGQPLTFFAWLGTPDQDPGRHRISQRAVNALTSIGGGGATDNVSRALLRFLDTFHYDRLGLGCYLYQGVCQLSGVEAVNGNYYIVKGGGLPRIDVLGYNVRVDWPVLWQRLKRISQAKGPEVR